MDNLNNMINFPMYCIDLKQILDERAKRWLGNIP